MVVSVNVMAHYRKSQGNHQTITGGWQPVGFKGNRLQIRLTSANFAAFWVNRTYY